MAKEVVKLLLLTDDMILYVENPKNFTKISKDSTHKNKIINKYNKVLGYKINMRKI